MMTAWFKRGRQTRTPVHDAQSETLSRRRGSFAAYRTLFAMQTSAQLFLWVTLFGYERAQQTTWQPMLLLLAPLGVLWLLWRAGHSAMGTKAGALISLLLIPCLMLDATLLVHALSGLVEQLIPTYPHAICTLAIVLLCYVTTCLGRENGVAYGAGALCLLLLVLFLFATVFLQTNADPGRLFPLLGAGIGSTLKTTLTGVGSVWGVALLFVLPLNKRPQAAAVMRAQEQGKWKRSLLFALFPLLLGVVWALYFSMVCPWRAGDMRSIGDRMLSLSVQSSSNLLGLLAGLLWLLLIPLSLAGSAMCGEKLLGNVARRLPRSISSAVVLLPALVLTLGWSTRLSGILELLLPYRAALSLIAGIAMLVVVKKEARA